MVKIEDLHLMFFLCQISQTEQPWGWDFFSQNTFDKVTELSEVPKDVHLHFYYILSNLVTALYFCFYREVSEQVKLSKKLQLAVEASF